MSITSLVQRLQDRPAVSPQEVPEAGRSVRTVAPGANTIFQAVCTPEPAPLLAFRPVFAPVALFAPEPVKVGSEGGESVPAGMSRADAEIAAGFPENRRTCRDCAKLSGAACTAQRVGGRQHSPVLDILRRCELYAPGIDDPDRRPVAQRWPGIGASS